MTEQKKLRRDIDTLRTSIQLALRELDDRSLPADQRRVIKDRVDILISDLRTLLKHDEIRRSPLRNP